MKLTGERNLFSPLLQTWLLHTELTSKYAGRCDDFLGGHGLRLVLGIVTFMILFNLILTITIV